jgi:hypothetical protein
MRMLSLDEGKHCTVRVGLDYNSYPRGENDASGAAGSLRAPTARAMSLRILEGRGR